MQQISQDEAPGQRFIRSPFVRFKERCIHVLLAATLLSVVLPVVLIVVYLFQQGMHQLSWHFIFQDPLNGMTEGGIRPAILGSLFLVLLTVCFAVPFGVFAAVYLTEYAQQNLLTRSIRLAIVNLAGVPSVVYGLFGLGLFVIALKFGASLLAGACTLAVLVLPMIITASEEALRTVPTSFRDASLALGVSKWQTIWKVVLPTSLPGILTGVILAVGRAAGETAPLMFTCAAFYLPSFLEDIPLGNAHQIATALHDLLAGQIMALPYHLYTVATQVPNASPGIKWGTALVLLMLVLGMNTLAIIIRSILRSARKW